MDIRTITDFRARLSPGVATLLLAGAMFCLALNHIIGRGMHEIMPPIGLSFWRWTAAGLLLLPLVRRGLAIKLPIYRKAWKVFTALGCLMTGSTTLFVVLLQYTTAINISLVNALQPTVTVLLTWAFFQQRLSTWQGLGVIIGMVGVATMVSQGSWQVLTSLSFNSADVIALIAVLGLAGYAICLRWLPEGLNPIDVLFGIVVMGCIALLPAYVLETLLYAPVPVNGSSVLAILAMAVFGSVIGNLLWNMGNQTLGPNKASIFINLIPVFSMLMAVSLLGEKLQVFHLAGFVMICSGVWLVLARKRSTTGRD